MSELATLLGAAFVYILLAMWVTGPPGTCDIRVEPHRYLNLERDVDREHLARDVAQIDRIARRSSAGLPDGEIERCREKLGHQLVTAHDLSPDQVRAAASAAREF